MECYVNKWDRIAWDFICAKLSENKRRIGTIYGIKMQPRGYGKTMTSRALFGSIMAGFSDDFDKITISIRWCEYFEIPNFRRRKNYIVHMAKIERYILPKTRIRG